MCVLVDGPASVLVSLLHAAWVKASENIRCECRVVYGQLVLTNVYLKDNNGS